MLTRALLLALAKSIYYYKVKALKTYLLVAFWADFPVFAIFQGKLEVRQSFKSFFLQPKL